MTQQWHSCIADELSRVEDLMMENLESENAELTEMCQYVISSGGKRLRPSLCILGYKVCGGDDVSKAIDVGSAFEIIHSATLIHDDINDQGDVRRGKKALHKAYTITKAIIAGDYMFAMGFRLLASAAPDRGVRRGSFRIDGCGEFVQKDFEHASNVTEEDYITIITGKTAKLFEASMRSGAAIANADAETMDALGNYAFTLGLAFQIMDDTLDVVGDSRNTGKLVGTDMIEGKPTLPVIYAMEDPVAGDRIKALFEKVDVTTDDVHEAIDLISTTDAVARCTSKAGEYIAAAKQYLSVLPDSPYKDSLIDLADYVIRRDR